MEVPNQCSAPRGDVVGEAHAVGAGHLRMAEGGEERGGERDEDHETGEHGAGDEHEAPHAVGLPVGPGQAAQHPPHRAAGHPPHRAAGARVAAPGRGQGHRLAGHQYRTLGSIIALTMSMSNDAVTTARAKRVMMPCTAT